MPDELGGLMFEFATDVQRHRTRELNRLGTKHGLSERDRAILEFLVKQPQGTARFSEIADELMQLADSSPTATSTISQAISALWKRSPQLVEKNPNPEDQRQPIISLTDEGRRIAESIRKVRVEVLEAVRDAMQLGPREAATLKKVMARGITSFKEYVARKAD